jgi:hypothetical protein
MPTEPEPRAPAVLTPPPQQGSIAVPDRPLNARLLIADVDVEARVADCRAEIVVPTAGLLEVVHVDWSDA